jgi:hypothetical protein
LYGRHGLIEARQEIAGRKKQRWIHSLERWPATAMIQVLIESRDCEELMMMEPVVLDIQSTNSRS